MNYYSITVDFVSKEPYTRCTLDEHIRKLVQDLGGKVTSTTVHIDEGDDQ